jgi:prophage tail gpP-like protein
MGIELVTITAGGMPYTAFKGVKVHAAFNEASRSFSFQVAAELGASATNRIFTVGAEVSINANGDLLLSGHVDERVPHFNATSAIISVSGRSKSADLVDGSAEHKTGQFEKKDPLEIGNEVCSNYGAKFESDQQLEKVDQYQLTQGESVFRCVEKLDETGTPRSLCAASGRSATARKTSRSRKPRPTAR